jgi:hypothetical protein
VDAVDRPTTDRRAAIHQMTWGVTRKGLARLAKTVDLKKAVVRRRAETVMNRRRRETAGHFKKAVPVDQMGVVAIRREELMADRTVDPKARNRTPVADQSTTAGRMVQIPASEWVDSRRRAE